MSAEVFGAFWRLQLYQFEHGHIPRFPDERARCAGCDLMRFETIVWPRLVDKFEPVDDAGNLGHPRMTETREREIQSWEVAKVKAKETKRQRSKAGRKGAAATNQETHQNNLTQCDRPLKTSEKRFGKQVDKTSAKGRQTLEGGRGKGDLPPSPLVINKSTTTHSANSLAVASGEDWEVVAVELAKCGVAVACSLHEAVNRGTVRTTPSRALSLIAWWRDNHEARGLGPGALWARVQWDSEDSEIDRGWPDERDKGKRPTKPPRTREEQWDAEERSIRVEGRRRGVPVDQIDQVVKDYRAKWDRKPP